MNDFLQSLRNGQAEKPRTPKTRKNYDNSYHYTSPPRFNSYGGYQNTRNQQMKRPPAQHQPGNQIPMDEPSMMALLSDAIENVCSHIETLVKNQDYLINAQERTADILERQAIAIERILDHLNIAPAPEDAPEEDSAPEEMFGHHYATSPEPELEIPAPAAPPAAKTERISPVVRKRKKTVTKKAKETAQADSSLLGRDAIMDIIHTMRDKGATFDQVAAHLVELGQPTFSGRGEWHAQTIHRLCNKK